MNAKELISRLKEKHRIMRNISEYVFGFQDANEQASLSNLSMEEAGEVMRKEIKNRELNIRQIKTYNMIKNAVWDCVLDL